MLGEDIPSSWNVKFEVRERGKLVESSEVHNVFTDDGRAWHGQLLGVASLQSDPPTPLVYTRPAYISVGCGGVMQTDSRFARRQAEVRAVTHLEDPVPISRVADVRTYLKRVYAMSLRNKVFYPDATRPRFITDFVEGEIAFAGNTTRTSSVEVGTSVPLSEFGLHLSSANTVFSHVAGVLGEADPLVSNGLIAYCIRSPIILTPNVSLRVQWELRV